MKIKPQGFKNEALNVSNNLHPYRSVITRLCIDARYRIDISNEIDMQDLIYGNEHTYLSK